MKKQDKKTKQYAGNNGHLWDGKKKCPAGLKKINDKVKVTKRVMEQITQLRKPEV